MPLGTLSHPPHTPDQASSAVLRCARAGHHTMLRCSKAATCLSCCQRACRHACLPSSIGAEQHQSPNPVAGCQAAHRRAAQQTNEQHQSPSSSIRRAAAFAAEIIRRAALRVGLDRLHQQLGEQQQRSTHHSIASAHVCMGACERATVSFHCLSGRLLPHAPVLRHLSVVGRQLHVCWMWTACAHVAAAARPPSRN